MWIAFRIVIALLAFFVRQVVRARKPTGGELIDGREQFVRMRTQKGKIRGYSLGVALEAPLAFRMHRESATDDFFKKIGWATEIESGDAQFDKLVYVVCDHPMLAALLKRKEDARAAVLAALSEGFAKISFDGHAIWLSKSVPRGPTADERAIAAALGRAFAPLERDRSGVLSDPFLWRALVVEGVVWSIAAYGIGAFIGMIAQQGDIHLEQGSLVAPGLVVAAALFAALLGLTIAMLRGSSRGHRLILESAFVLIVGLPPTGVQLFADLNQSLDTSREKIGVRIESCETRVTTSYRRGRKRTSTSYYLHIGRAEPSRVTIPVLLKTDHDLCSKTTSGADATFVVGRGAFGRAWIREIRVPGLVWTG